MRNAAENDDETSNAGALLQSMTSSTCRILLRERPSQGKRVKKTHSSQMEDSSTVSRQKRRIHREKEDTGIVKPKGESHKRSFSFIREDALIHMNDDSVPDSSLRIKIDERCYKVVVALHMNDSRGVYCAFCVRERRSCSASRSCCFTLIKSRPPRRLTRARRAAEASPSRER